MTAGKPSSPEIQPSQASQDMLETIREILAGSIGEGRPRNNQPMLDVQITSSAEVMRQASMTANDYMLDAKAMIDAAFGTDYAYEHPELVAAFMRTAAQDFHTAMMKVAAQDVRDVLEAVGGR